MQVSVTLKQNKNQCSHKPHRLYPTVFIQYLFLDKHCSSLVWYNLGRKERENVLPTYSYLPKKNNILAETQVFFFGGGPK